MFLEIKSLLTPAEVGRLIELSGKLAFVDGRISNPANHTKNNLQADHADQGYQESGEIVAAAFARSRDFQNFAFPKDLAPPLLCRYEPGMKYGKHSDAAFVRVASDLLRTDLSSTVWIAAPSGYEGGELTIQLGTRRVSFKGAPGDALVYPSTTLHEVEPVRSGTRLVSITFIESLIADEHKRIQLHELNEVLALEGLNMQWENRMRLEAVSARLMRMWSS